MISRADLRTGFRDAQEIHVAYAVGRMVGPGGPDFPYAIALTVPGEMELRALAASLEQRGIICKLIEEPDAPWNGAATALACEPMPKSQGRRLFSSLPTLKERHASANSSTPG